MHFALPPRKTSRPPPYAARQNSALPRLPLPPALRNLLRRDRLRVGAALILGIIGVFWLLGRMGGGSAAGSKVVPNLPRVAPGSGPEVVIVTVLDPQSDPKWQARIKRNREEYARRHGYKTFFPSPSQYPLGDAPNSWARVPALRHAMTLFPGSTFLWSLDATALIANPVLSLTDHLLSPSRLEAQLLPNAPVVPPDSVIKTFSNVKGGRIDFVLSQDKDGLSDASFFIRNGEWAKFFLDVWFDPMYRTYNFQKAEAHALEHIVQWHGTILAKLALVPQSVLNSYASGPAGPQGQYKKGDLVANFAGCDRDGRDCAKEQLGLWETLSTS